jgi:hypothetical protein
MEHGGSVKAILKHHHNILASFAHKAAMTD